MHLAAIVERRPPHWYVSIPALATGGPVPGPNDVQASAVAMAAAAAGLPATEVQVRLYLAGPGDTVVPTSVTDVEARHNDGIWHAAEHTGWLRQWNGSWWPLVSYAADGEMWTRAVRASSIRQSAADGPAVPEPRANVESKHLARQGGGVSGSV